MWRIHRSDNGPNVPTKPWSMMTTGKSSRIDSFLAPWRSGLRVTNAALMKKTSIHAAQCSMHLPRLIATNPPREHRNPRENWMDPMVPMNVRQ